MYCKFLSNEYFMKSLVFEYRDFNLRFDIGCYYSVV